MNPWFLAPQMPAKHTYQMKIVWGMPVKQPLPGLFNQPFSQVTATNFGSGTLDEIEVITIQVLNGFMQSITHILQGCFTGTGAIIWLPQCQWNNPEYMGDSNQNQTATKHNNVWTLCRGLGKYCPCIIKYILKNMGELQLVTNLNKI